MKVDIRNFMSYEQETIDFGDSHTTLVAGSNGSGKSAALESIHFCLYGSGRISPTEEMTRIQGDGTMSVTVYMRVGEYGEVQFSRSYDGKRGRFEVKTIDSEEVDLKGSEAQDFVIQVFGTEEDFLLTKFYGLTELNKAKNPLIATPSEALDSLQAFAQAHAYLQFSKVTSERKKQAEKRVTVLEGLIDNTEIEDVPELENKLDLLQRKVRKANKELREIRGQRSELDETEERFRNLMSRQEVTKKEIQSQIEWIADIEEEISQAESQIRGSESDWKEVNEKVQSLVSEREKWRSRDEVSEELQSVRDQIVDKESKIALYLSAQAAHSDGESECPLCHSSEYSESVVEEWKQKEEELTKEVSGLRLRQSELVAESQRIVDLERDLSRSETELSRLNEKGEKARSDLQGFQHKLKQLVAKREKLEGDLGGIQKQLKQSEFEGLQEKIQELSSENDRVVELIGALTSEQSGVEKSIKEAESKKKKLVQQKGELEDLKVQVQALSVLSEAFSRYGIPYDILSGVLRTLNEVCTSVYQDFDSGAQVNIELDESGKRPGVRFYLQDIGGKKDYRKLSTGQRAMYFFSYRVAVNKILSQSKGLQGDFIVLDEIAANLDQQNVRNLIRVTEKTVRKWFPVVMMVSHVAVPGVFDQVLNVSMDNDGISRISYS